MTGRICGTGSCLPELRVTNEDLSNRMDTSDEWIKSRTGIEARHLAVEETTTGMAVCAAKEAMSQAGIDAQEIELIIAATVTPDYLFPYLSGEVQREIGASGAVAFDIGAACSGFLFALGMAYAYLKSGLYKNALIIGAETLSKIMDWNDRSTCVLFGDGAGAAVLKADTQGIRSIVQGSDGAKGMVLSCRGRMPDNPFLRQEQQESGPFYVQMNGQEVYKFAVRTVPACIEQALEEAGLCAGDVKLFVLHQANYRIIEAVAKRLKQPMEKFPTCLQECGNISAASVPILLDKINQDGKLKKGDTVVLAGFGAGLTWGACVLTW
ncbi:MAG: beta-ketoacyl-ACP synthase III [Lachnospiraceae bacterium]